ncbi:MAG TPA: hypothetical protein VGH36_14610 [Acetobacteraceae bacterium]
MARLGGRAAVVISLVPVVAALLTIPVNGEVPSAVEAIAITAIAVGAVLAARAALPMERGGNSIVVSNLKTAACPAYQRRLTARWLPSLYSRFLLFCKSMFKDWFLCWISSPAWKWLSSSYQGHEHAQNHPNPRHRRRYWTGAETHPIIVLGRRNGGLCRCGRMTTAVNYC